MGRRLTVIPWSCHKSGDCCKSTDHVLMTKEEGEALRSLLPVEKWETLRWEPGPPSTTGVFVKLVAAPCPLLNEDGTCSVYEARPYSCRRFACLRPDLDEPFEGGHGDFACANARERIEDSRDARRFMIRLQRKAQRWASQHGWRA